VPDSPRGLSRFLGEPDDLSSMARSAARRLLRSFGYTHNGRRLVKIKPPPRPAPTTTIEEFDDRKVQGWIVDKPSNFPVRVALFVNDLEVANTWADQGSLNEAGLYAAPFRIVLRGLWDYCGRDDRLTVHVAGEPVAISGDVTFRPPTEDGEFALEDLKAKFAEGFLFGQFGVLQLSKTLDLEWQESVLGLYRRISEVLIREHGYEPFGIYGTLLGAVRDGDFIGHDLDFDAGYLSRHSDGRAVAAELRDIAMTFIDGGFHAELLRTVLHIREAQDGLRIDLFPMYFNGKDQLAIPFGVAGRSKVLKASWRGLVPGRLGRHEIPIPANGEELVEHLYGSSWRTPIAGFSWDRARVSRSHRGVLPLTYLEDVYWANFYAHHVMADASTFFEALRIRPDLPRTVLDIGCGDGRDSWAFARDGRRVIGIDRSEIGIRHATQRAEESELGDVLTFLAVDVSDAATLRVAIDEARAAAGDEPLLFYLRFFLHSITARVQERLMKSIAEASRAGDVFAAEFRTEQDESAPKIYEKHYRRFQDGPTFGLALAERYGFDIQHEEQGTGLARFGDEDPHVYRVIARRAANRNQR
jgi:SAM-dependent methyltransferase